MRILVVHATLRGRYAVTYYLHLSERKFIRLKSYAKSCKLKLFPKNADVGICVISITKKKCKSVFSLAKMDKSG